MTPQSTSLGGLGRTYGGLTGKTKVDFGTGDSRYVTFMDVITSVRVVGDQLEKVRVSKSEHQNCVRKGDVLFNGSSETPEEVALSAVVDADLPDRTFLNSFCFGYRLNDYDELFAQYLAYYFRSPAGRERVASLAQGATRYNISKIKFMQLEIPTPSASEMERAVGTLRACDELVLSLQRLTAKRQAVKQGTMQRLLTGQIRLPGFGEPWRPVRLGEVSTMSSGGTPLSTNSSFFGGGIPWVSISDMTRAGKYVRVTEKTLSQEGLANSSARLYEPTALLYAMYASLGECALPVGAMASSQAILGIVPLPKVLNREFLYYWLCSKREQVKELGQQGTQSNLNAGMVRGFELQLPTVEEQKAIASVLADQDREMDSLDARMRKARDIRLGAMQRLFAGGSRFAGQEVLV